MIHITEWDMRYEVDEKGGPLTVGKLRRKMPLVFIRLKVHGKEQGIGWRKLLTRAGPNTLQVFGCFCKLLELAGCKERDRRGYVDDNEDGGLAFILSVPDAQVTFCLEVLREIGWIELVDDESLDSSVIIKNSRNSRNSRNPGVTNPNGTERNRTDQNLTEPNGTKPSSWEVARAAVRSVFGSDDGITQAMTAIGNHYASDVARADEVATTIRQLIKDSQKPNVTNPAGYFIGALRKRFPCVR